MTELTLAFQDSKANKKPLFISSFCSTFKDEFCFELAEKCAEAILESDNSDLAKFLEDKNLESKECIVKKLYFLTKDQNKRIYLYHKGADQKNERTWEKVQGKCFSSSDCNNEVCICLGTINRFGICNKDGNQANEIDMFDFHEPRLGADGNGIHRADNRD